MCEINMLNNKLDPDVVFPELSGWCPWCEWSPGIEELVLQGH
jgi:hypothetical protein